MGEHATRVQARLRKRLADRRPDLAWETEYDLDGTRVDVAGVSDEVLVLVELEWRRADPVDNTATLFRHLAEGVLSDPGPDLHSNSDSTPNSHSDTATTSRPRPVVVAQLFTASYDLARGGVSSKRRNAEFVGARLAASFPHVSYHGVSVSLTPPRADGSLPDEWRESVDDAVTDVEHALDGL